MSSHLTHHTSTDDVTTDSARLKAIACTGDGGAGSVVVREGGSGGTIVATLRAPSGDTATFTLADPNGALCEGGIHVTISSAEVTVEWED